MNDGYCFRDELSIRNKICEGGLERHSSGANISYSPPLVPLFTTSASFSRGFFMPQICEGVLERHSSGANISYSPPAGSNFYNSNEID